MMVKDTFSNMRKQLNEFWQGLTPAQKNRIIIAAVLIIAGIAITGAVLGRQQYTVLYSGLDIKEAGEITQKLDEMGVPWRAAAGGTAIEVPKGQDAKIRMQLATEGIPKTGGNYDLFMQSSAFGTTDYKEQKLYIFQQQERLQESIMTIQGVDQAVVNISVPEEDSFVLKEDVQPATASVLLKLSPGVEMKSAQVSGIQQLVAKSVIGLQPENVTVIDDQANILSVEKKEDDIATADQQVDLEKKVQDELQQELLQLLEPIFGHKKVVVGVGVQLDFDKRSSESIQWQPVLDDEGIAVSMQTIKESMVNMPAGEVPGTATNGADTGGGTPLPNGDNTQNNPNGYPATNQANSEYNKEENTINYEVNQLKQQVEEAQGKLKSMTISVVVDGENISEQVRQQVQSVVAGAAGIDAQYVTVQAMPFSVASLQEDINNALNASQQQKQAENMRNIMLGLIAAAVVGAAVFIAVRATNARRRAAETEMAEAAVPEGVSIEEIPMESEDEHTKIKQQIEKLVDQKPDVVAQLLRTWLNEE
ncbi:flagellar basal-body MS-ring/collar protein FliF [Mahella sp.]|uniref:flagellar basal-body MS-ring/collar protein FliF n=1 Tax=Mahella sp. TaxID=2798721 RepID=UPI0025C55924|nr:flagellar basal-body MS-ring/collar protein FliF [Mahella sp.]MBZ4666243.1 flagellar M-ring protein FliF [Mahella sp.]